MNTVRALTAALVLGALPATAQDPTPVPVPAPAPAPATAPAATDKPIALIVGQCLPMLGAEAGRTVIIVADGRIVAVGPDVAIPANAEKIELPDAIAMPGLVDPVTRVGGGEDLSEPAGALLPEMRAADALDPWHPEVAALAESGVTLFGLVPQPDNLLGGFAAACVVLPGTTPADPRAAVLREEAATTFSLTDDAWRTERPPASRMGAVAWLRRIYGGSAGGPPPGVEQVGRDPRVVQAALDRGRTAGPALVHTDRAEEIEAALDVLRAPFTRGLACLFPREDPATPRRLAEADVVVVLRAPSPEDLDLDLGRAGRLAAAGVRVAFASNAPDGRPDRLLRGAALAHAAGMPREAALRALTLHGAAVLGVDDAGALAAGRRADILLLGADPLSGHAPVLGILAGGKWIRRPAAGSGAKK